MPALIRTLECFNVKSAEFVTTYEADCANCGEPFRWVLEEGRLNEGEGIPTIISTDSIEWEEVPPTVRPSLLRPVIELKKRKLRKNNSFGAKVEAIKNWMSIHQDVNLDEIKYAISLLELNYSEAPVISYLMAIITAKMREVSDWDSVTKLMFHRSTDVKQAVWNKLTKSEKHKFNTWKHEYNQQLAIWATEDNLKAIAMDLEACTTLEMVWELWHIYNREAIRLASKRVIGDKGDRIRALIQKIDDFT